VRILHLTDRLSRRGGAYWHLYGVIAGLLERGNDVRLAVGVREPGTRDPCPTDVLPGLESRTRAPVALDALVARVRPDLVHLHTVVNPAVLDWAAGREAVLTVQDHRYFCPTRGKWTASGRVCREVLSRAACASCFDDPAYFEDVYGLTQARLRAAARLRLIVLSRYMRGELIAAGVPAGRIEVVPPFVHGLDPASPADRPPCVLFVGRLTASKGALDAVAAWRASGLDLPLVAAGAGRLRGALESAGATVLGWLDHPRLAGLYRSAVVVVMPSRWQEPFGIAGLEAVTLGTPVAAWDSGGVSEWHPGEGLAPWGDGDALARALAAVAGTRASPRPGFDREALMDRLVSVCETALAASARIERRLESTR
jgi:glycosyltransferase involved in cell wall biosynthesis